MLIQAVAFSLLAAISPTGLLVAAVFLGSASPRLTAMAYVAGAIGMTVLGAAILFVLLRAGGLDRPDALQARYDFRLGLGIALLLAAGYLRRRGLRSREKSEQLPGPMARMIARPGPAVAFVAGVAIYVPSLTFVAAVQAVATTEPGVVNAVLLLTVVVVITATAAWLPLVSYLFSPERTGQQLALFNGWLRLHGYLLLVGAAGICGLALVVNGALGLAGVA